MVNKQNITNRDPRKYALIGIAVWVLFLAVTNTPILVVQWLGPDSADTQFIQSKSFWVAFIFIAPVFAAWLSASFIKDWSDVAHRKESRPITIIAFVVATILTALALSCLAYVVYVGLLLLRLGL